MTRLPIIIVIILFCSGALGCHRNKKTNTAARGPVATPTITSGLSERIAEAIESGDIETILSNRESLRTLGVQWATAGVYPVLHYACRNGSTEVVKALLGAGCSVHEIDRDGLTPIGEALNRSADRVSPEMVLSLIDAGAPLDGPVDANGSTPLKLAAAKDAASLIRVLLDRGADPLSHSAKLTPLEIAIGRGHPGTVQLLLDAAMAKGMTKPDKEGVCSALARLKIRVREAQALASSTDRNTVVSGQETIDLLTARLEACE